MATENNDFIYNKVCTQTLLINTIEPPKNNNSKFRKSSILKFVSMLMLNPLLTISS